MSEAQRVEDEVPAAEGKRVLVAEDSPVTQDLLKLMLTQRGHQVDIVQDGDEALKALGRVAYDVALLDFHLPKMDGLQVALEVRKQRSQEHRPRLVAITADMDGLLAHGEACDVFDQVLPKPLDIYEIGTVIEGAADPDEAPAGEVGGRDAAAPAPVDGVLASRVRTPRSPEARRTALAIENLSFEFLSWPDDFDTARLSPRVLAATTGEARFDAILVRAPAGVGDLAALWQRKHLHLLPVIDLAGRLGPAADLDASRLSYGDTAAVERLIEGFQERRAGLHRDLVLTNELGEKLLGRILLRGEPLRPAYDPNSTGLVAYNVTLDPAVVVREADKQCMSGFLASEFFDRFHQCGRCGSARLNVREECGKCRSANLAEEPYLHHFKCAYQGPETDFRHGDDLICPKCRQELSHFSVDYDKPGAMIVCAACGHAASEPAVGFACLDCGAHTDGDAAHTRDVHAYALTEQGRGFLELGRSLLGPAQQTLRFSDLPLEFMVALNGAAKLYNEKKTPFTVFNIAYRNEREIVREAGPRQFSQARALFVDALRSVLRKSDIVVMGHAYDFALLQDVSQQEAGRAVDYVRREATDTLRLDLGVEIAMFGPEDFA